MFCLKENKNNSPLVHLKNNHLLSMIMNWNDKPIKLFRFSHCLQESLSQVRTKQNDVMCGRCCKSDGDIQ